MMIISNGKVKGSWHVGEEMNIPEGRVLTFSVDGDELNWLIDTLAGEEARGSGILPRINWPSHRLTPIL